MKLTKIISEAYSRNSALESAVKNRRKIVFYYAGPRSGKESVRPGNRIEVLPVAVGSTKGRNNMAIKGWVENDSSVTKTGFEKGKWRTFLVSRLHQLEITNDTFEREDLPDNYKEGPDNSFQQTYTTIDWSKKIYKRKFEKERSRRQQAAKDKEDREREAMGNEPDMGGEPGMGAEPGMGSMATMGGPTDLPQPRPDDTPPVDPESPTPTPTATPDLNNPEPETEYEPEMSGDDEEEEDFNLQESINRIKCLISF